MSPGSGGSENKTIALDLYIYLPEGIIYADVSPGG